MEPPLFLVSVTVLLLGRDPTTMATLIKNMGRENRPSDRTTGVVLT